MPFGLRLPQFLTNRITSKNKDEPTRKLSYQSLRSVLEYMDANRRIRLSARCPALQKFERTVPLHFRFLRLTDWCIRIDRVSYELKTITNGSRDEESDWDQELMPGDIIIEKGNDRHRRPEGLGRTQMKNLEIVFKGVKSRKFTRRVPENIEMHVAMKKLACYLFQGRREIRVSQIWTYFYNQKVLRLPVGLKFQINSLDTEVEHLDSMLQLIDESSFPLKKLKFDVVDQECFQHPVVRSSEYLWMISCRIESVLWMEILKDLPNKIICVQLVIFSLQDILTIVQNWMDNNPEIGKCFILQCDKEMFISKLLPEIEERYDGAVIKGVYGRLLSRTEVRGVTIPMNSTSNLNIHLKDTFSLDYDNNVEFEMTVTPYISVAPLIPVVKDKLSDQIESFWKGERITFMIASCPLLIFTCFFGLCLFFSKFN